MPTRRQEKVARVIKEAVSDAIANHLNDPRIDGFVSVTRVDTAADLRTADVYLSIFTREPDSRNGAKWDPHKDDVAQNKTFLAIKHAKSRIQSLLASRLKSKFCPVLHLRRDEKFKKTLETMKLIDQAVNELKKKELSDQEGD